MKCAWQSYLNLLPPWMRNQVDRLGCETLEELRLRLGRPPELVTSTECRYLERNIKAEDLSYCVNAASQYSPWSAATIANGYITASGGHRIGVCGDIAMINGKISTVTHISSLCLRVARDFPGIGLQAAQLQGNVLILGSPGRGKTTLLRDLFREISTCIKGAVAVVDERRELFPTVCDSFVFSPGIRTEVLSGCSKSAGIEMLIRTMNPSYVVVDEITAVEDSQALIHACWCGVSLLATAHAENLRDFMSRPVYKPLIQSRVFENIIVMQPDKSWKVERMNI